MAQMNLSTRQKQTHRHREQTCGCQGEGRGGGMELEFGISRWNYYIYNGLITRSHCIA